MSSHFSVEKCPYKEFTLVFLSAAASGRGDCEEIDLLLVHKRQETEYILSYDNNNNKSMIIIISNRLTVHKCIMIITNRLAVHNYMIIIITNRLLVHKRQEMELLVPAFRFMPYL